MWGILAPIIPFVGSLLVIVAWATKSRYSGHIGASFIGLSFIFSILAAKNIFLEEEPLHEILAQATWLGGPYGFYYDALSSIMALVVSGLSFLIAIYSIYYMKHEYGYERYFIFFTFFVGSMMIVVTADNLLLLFIGWEGTGLASYALISHWFRDEEERYVGDIGRTRFGTPMFFSPTHSGIRALMFTRLPDVGFLVGIFIIYYLTGTTNLVTLADSPDKLVSLLGNKGLLVAVLALLTVGAMGKSAQFPFTEWLVTAMTGPTPVSALIHAATMVKAGVYLLLRVYPIFVAGLNMLTINDPSLGGLLWSQAKPFFLAVSTIGAFTAFMTASMALVARELKLVLALSTASQLGYMFAGIGLIGFVNPVLVVAGVLAHLMAHAVFKASLFMGAGVIIHEGGSKYIDNLPLLSPGLRKTLLAMWLSTLSLAGIPPLIGFWSKEFIVGLSVESGAYVVAGFTIITIIMTAFYATRMLWVNSRYNTGKKEIHDAPLYALSTYLLLGIVALLLGLIWPITEEGYIETISHTLGLMESTAHAGGLGITAGIGLLLAISGIGLSYVSYVAARINTKEIAAKIGIINDFLYDRWFVNPIFYRVIVYPGGWLANKVYSVVEGGLDRAIHIKLTEATGRLSRYFTSWQSGDLLAYIMYFVAGVVFVLVLLLVGLGVIS